MEFNALRIKKIVEETADTKSLFFEVPEELKTHYQYQSGQYITIRHHFNGDEVRRSYSICSPAHSTELAVTAKKMSGGTMSVFLNEEVSEGDALEISPPEGRFVVDPDPENTRDLYFFAAGSGITPVISMIETILEGEPKSTCYLLYGSRNEENIIFRDRLEDLELKYEQQLYVVHTLSKPYREKAGGISGFFGKKTVSWPGQVGRIDKNLVKDFLAKYPSRSGRNEFFICGPGNLIENTEKTLRSEGIIADNIHKEYFTTTGEPAEEGSGKKALLTVTLDRMQHKIEVKADETILEAMLRENLDAPYSCTSGSCSTCLAKTIQGDISMDAYYALEDEEVEEGYILTCQSRIQSSQAEITYDV